MKFENTSVMNFDGALRGMRNPKNSWKLNDSKYDENGNFVIGPNDLKLAKTLIKAGTEHRKFLRQVFVCVDITAPQYFMAELDTYKIGVTRDSCSVQHKGMSKEYDIDDFEVPDEVKYYVKNIMEVEKADSDVAQQVNFWVSTIANLNAIREKYLETKDYTYFRTLRQLLPMGYLYRATFTMSYENVLNMYRQRKNHLLDEWSGRKGIVEQSFVDWVHTLPYFDEFIEAAGA